jgi:peptide methionine sulfoxide reductase msrA/msrB
MDKTEIELNHGGNVMANQSISVLAIAALAGLLVMVLGHARVSESAELKEAYFAGGCFWCMEPPFEKLDGVKDAVSGYMGGHRKDPTYKEVSAGTTGHAEIVKVIYDPAKVTYRDLLQVFWRQIDPTDAGGSFVDRGSQYRSAIFYTSEEEKAQAEGSRDEMAKSGRFNKPIVTEIVSATEFYRAEEYHQDYYKKSTIKYKFYRFNSGRDRYLKKIWGKESSSNPAPSGQASSNPKWKGGEGFVKPSKAELKKKLTKMQYEVTQKEGTEPPFDNEYWDNKREGIYVDLISGEPLFSSIDKYVSGTGWPSFSRVMAPENIVEKDDYRLFSKRTEIRSRIGDSHLGHLFPQDISPTGLRYCMNSAALRFIPKEDLEKEGYGEFLRLFED